MKQIIGYSPSELKEVNEEGFERALEHWRNSQDEIFWTDEIMQSLKETFKHSNIALRDWSIGAYSHSYVRFDMESDVRDLSGNRAIAWLENNLLGDLRIKWQPYGRVDREHHFKSVRAELAKYGQYYRPGMIKPCPFTGYCADEDFIESLVKDVRDGDTLQEAYSNLADVARKLFENELDYQNSEEYFLEQEHLLYTIEGHSL